MSRRPEDPSLVLRRAHHRTSIILVLVGLGYVLLALRAVPLMLMPDDRLAAQAALQFQASVSVEEHERRELDEGLRPARSSAF